MRTDGLSIEDYFEMTDGFKGVSNLEFWKMMRGFCSTRVYLMNQWAENPNDEEALKKWLECDAKYQFYYSHRPNATNWRGNSGATDGRKKKRMRVKKLGATNKIVQAAPQEEWTPNLDVAFC